jgi:hypothetical protein
MNKFLIDNPFKSLRHGSKILPIDPALCHFDPALFRKAKDLHTDLIEK